MNSDDDDIFDIFSDIDPAKVAEEKARYGYIDKPITEELPVIDMKQWKTKILKYNENILAYEEVEVTDEDFPTMQPDGRDFSPIPSTLRDYVTPAIPTRVPTKSLAMRQWEALEEARIAAELIADLERAMTDYKPSRNKIDWDSFALNEAREFEGLHVPAVKKSLTGWKNLNKNARTDFLIEKLAPGKHRITRVL